MKAIPLLLLAAALTGCGKQYDPAAVGQALEALREASRDVVVKTAEAEKVMATEEQKEALKRAQAALTQAEKAARGSGAAETQLWERKRIGETEGRKIVLEWVR